MDVATQLELYLLICTYSKCLLFNVNTLYGVLTPFVKDQLVRINVQRRDYGAEQVWLSKYFVPIKKFSSRKISIVMAYIISGLRH